MKDYNNLMFCVKCWSGKFSMQLSTERPSGQIECLGKFLFDGSSYRLFNATPIDGNACTPYVKRLRDCGGEKEHDALEYALAASWKDKYNVKAICAPRELILSNGRVMKMQQYNVGQSLAPLVSISGVVGKEFIKMIVAFAKDVHYDRGAGKAINKNHKHAIQGGRKYDSNRCKIHFGHAYNTNNNDGDTSLRRCTLRIRDMCNTEKKMKMLGSLLRNLYQIGMQLGMKHEDCQFLLRRPGHISQVFLVVLYNGGGLRGHLDDNFESAVWSIECEDSARDGSVRVTCKMISFGMEGPNVVNPKAQISIEVGDAYVFWGWLREGGVHGVPNAKGNMSVMFIVRKGKFSMLL